jgi:hypothetical protein
MKASERVAWTEAITKKAAKKEGRVKNVRKKVIDGITFDSTKEARRWQDLVLMQKAGQIDGLRRQIPFDISINGVFICIWFADFVYTRDGVEVTEDTKGVRTEVYRLKRRLVEALYGIVILET